MDSPSVTLTRDAERKLLGERLQNARAELMCAAQHADTLGATAAHQKVMLSVATIDDALVSLTEGVAR